MTSAQLHYISREIIHSIPPTHSTQTLELTPWDLQLLGIHAIQKGLLFRRPKHSEWLTRLKSSLSQTLHHFFPLTGRLATRTNPQDDNISVFIHCNNAGAQFVHAGAHLTISDILDPPNTPCIVNDFFPLNFAVNYDGVSQPLLAVQVTELIDGVFIGCTMNHVAADGTNFWNFMNSWSHICRTGTNEIPISPNFSRSFCKDLPIHFPLSAMQKSIRYYDHLPPNFEECVFHFTPLNIAGLKEIANLEHNNDSTNKTTISSLQAVLAHMWMGVLRAKRLDSDEEVSYRLLMGNRGRLNPALPEGYLGNSVSFGIATAKVGELMKGGLGFAAGLMNKTVRTHTSENIWDEWEQWLKEPKFACHASTGIDSLTTGSSPRFDVYGNDFGWGAPIAVRSGVGNKLSDKLTVFPGPVKGSMEIETCISNDVLMALNHDSEFMEYVGATAYRNRSIDILVPQLSP